MLLVVLAGGLDLSQSSGEPIWLAGEQPDVRTGLSQGLRQARPMPLIHR